MDQAIVIIIFLAIAIINYLVRQGASKPGGGSRPSNLPQSRRPAQEGQPGDDERLRKFMEALGVPAAAAPPPRRIATPQAPFAPRTRAAVKRQAAPPPVAARRVYTPPPPVQSAYQAEMVGAQSPATTGFEVATHPSQMAGAPPTDTAQTSTATDLKSLLRSPSSIRAAMVLKEILGAPKGLQSADTIPGLR
jgi:hypothetical protein